MAPGKRSLEGRRKNRARYRAKRARAAEVDQPIPPMPVASSAGSPQHDDVGGSSALHPWEANASEVFASFSPESIPPVDGTGFPDLSQWDGDISFSPRYEKLSLALAKAVRAKAEAWVSRPEVRNFLLRYEQASRLEQTEMANKWVALGIERESEQLAATLARLLESAGLGSSETLLQSASPISPIRGRLLESRVTWPGEGPEDCGIAAVAMSGMPLGLSVPFPEDLRTWPAFHEQPLRPGEPEVDDSAMARLLDEQIKRELETGKMISMNRSTFRETGGLGISKANVIWKDAAHSKIRIISNYRTSGVNHASRMLTTTLYPGLPQIRLLLREVGPGSALAEYDVSSAFRTLQTHPLECRFLALRDPRPSAPPDGILYDLAVPFGAKASCSVFVRVNSAIHRTQRRLLGAAYDRLSGPFCMEGEDRIGRGHAFARSRRPRGFIFVDDSRWVFTSILGLVMLLMLALVYRVGVEYGKVHYLSGDCRVLGWKVDCNSDTKCEGEKGSPCLSIPPEKAERYSGMIEQMLADGVTSTSEFASILGKLAWCAQLMVVWRPHLASLYAQKAIAEKRSLHSFRLGGKVL
ncbi:hypothetical protein FOZ62_029447, partial [Perkinsus olseni]